MASLLLGFNQGLEAGEFPLPIDAVIFLVIGLVTVQFLATIAQRRKPQLYVAVWYLIGAYVWAVMNLILGSFILPHGITGINSAAFH
jgi:cytochrome c oxidase cbb3-type subunit I